MHFFKIATASLPLFTPLVLAQVDDDANGIVDANGITVQILSKDAGHQYHPLPGQCTAVTPVLAFTIQNTDPCEFYEHDRCGGSSFFEQAGTHKLFPPKKISSFRCSGMNPPKPSKLQYGKCYYLTSTAVGLRLGSHSDVYYRFGDLFEDIPMQVCHSTSNCSSHSGEVVKSWDKWYLQDRIGTSYSGAPAWAAIHNHSLAAYPETQDWDAVMFTGDYNCDDGRCSICMRPKNHYGRTGLKLGGDYRLEFRGSPNVECVKVWYEEVACSHTSNPSQHLLSQGGEL